MAREAKIVEEPGGAHAEGPGWYVLNLGDVGWKSGGERFGSMAMLEGEPGRFVHAGFNVMVVEPGVPSCLYHRESVEEHFLVLHGECLLVIDGEERLLRQWDFVHVPPGVDHVFVGAGEGPCAILGAGARTADKEITYPVNAIAAAHGASVVTETHSPKEAYGAAGVREWRDASVDWPL